MFLVAPSTRPHREIPAAVATPSASLVPNPRSILTTTSPIPACITRTMIICLRSLAGIFHHHRHHRPTQALVTITRARHFSTPASHPTDAPARPPSPTAAKIMDMASNKATRFVYLRTLPLVKQPELSGEVDAIAESIRQMTASLCEKHRASIVDDRSAVHLHTAALAIATHRVLAPRIRNEFRLINVIRAGYGAALVPGPGAGDEQVAQNEAGERLKPDYWVVRAALWFSFDRMKAVRKMTGNMARDFGESFETASRDTKGVHGETHSLVVTKCFYDKVCRDEGLPHLTKIFCALDKAIYSPITKESHGISFSLDRTLADYSAEQEQDDRITPACEFKFQADNNTT